MSQSSPTLPKTMRGMEIADGKLVVGEFALPKIRSDELLIRVAYAGINHADIHQRNGKYPAPEGASPLPGMEVSGWVAAVGAEAGNWAVGAEVCALLAGGGYAEYVAVPAGQVLALPKGVSLKDAACLPEAAATAVMALSVEAGLQSGERVLMHGGTSGLGLILTQIAKAWGADVFTTVGGHEKVKFMAPFGLQVIDHKAQDFVHEINGLTKGAGVDVIVDTIGGDYVQKHLGLLARDGRMVSLAMMGGAALESLKIGRMLTHRLTWKGTTLRSHTAAQKAAIMTQVRDRVWPAVAAGQVKPVVDSVFPLAEAEKALAHMQERLHLGKILLEVAAN